MMRFRNSFTFIIIVAFAISQFSNVDSGIIEVNAKNEKAVVVNPIREPIHFQSNGKFKIINFADLHYGEDQSSNIGPEKDRRSTQVQRDILRWENPDFVVYTGDIVSGEVFSPGNGTAYIDLVLEAVVEGNYRWATTYGNHDVGNNIARDEILATEQKYPNCYTRQGEDGLVGNTNYFIPIYPPQQINGTQSGSRSGRNDTDEIPAVILWFFDSRGGRNSSGGISAYVHETVVEWFVRENQRMKEQWGPIPSFAYFHYPTSEFSPIHDNLDQYPECTGQKDDIVTPQEKETGLMDALVNSGTVRTAFVGHNHGNGWCCYYRTLELCYNRQSGHGGGWIGWIRGARVVELDLANLWGQNTNYIRLENGTVIDYFPRQGSKIN